MSLTEKNSYWTRVVNEIERKSRQQSKKNVIKNYDFAVTLPEKLRQRVAKIIPYEFEDYDRNVFITELTTEKPLKFSEDEAESEVEVELEAENQIPSSTESLRSVKELVKPLEHKTKSKTKHNWYSWYIFKPRKERVKWDSKVYDMEGNIWEKTLDEQAEQVMDASAEHFTEWLNALGSSKATNITKDSIKALFSIETEQKLLSAAANENKELENFAKLVDDKKNLPEMANELNYENFVPDILKNVSKKFVNVAFGRTIPAHERTNWQPKESFKPITSVYPRELLTFEKLFKGITHLRSTKMLVEFYKTRPDLQKPTYLVTEGLLKQTAEAYTVKEVPLYERLKLQY